MDAKHSHYKKDVTGLSMIDVYRVLDLFGVTDPCIQHACKKLLVTGNRGHKNTDQDIQDAIDTLERWKEMRAEDRQRQSDRHPMTPNVVEYGSKTPDIKTVRISVSAQQPKPMIDILVDEPASQTQDDSPRMAAIGQNGNGGEHYFKVGDEVRALFQCRHIPYGSVCEVVKVPSDPLALHQIAWNGSVVWADPQKLCHEGLQP